MDLYIQIDLGSTDFKSETTICTDILNKVHKFNSLKQGILAIAFPHWKTPSDRIKGRFGSVVRIFSSKKESLLAFKQAHSYLNFSDVLSVPSTVTGYVKFIKDMTNVRSKPKQQMKTIERRIKAGLPVDMSLIKPTTIKPSLFVITDSHSSKQRFSLYIRQEVVDTAGGNEFNSYGLSKNNSTLPMF